MDTQEQIIASDDERLQAVQKVFSREFQERLFKYSLIRLVQKFGIKYDLKRGFRGLMIEDIISELMLSFSRKDGGRNWNKTKFPEFENQVFSSLDSTISNTLKKELEQTALTNTQIEDAKSEFSDDTRYTELLDASTRILEELGASDEELLLFEPYVINGMKRKDIAETFGISEIEATNIKKKIERKLPELREQFKNMDI